jgi:hypothetical protein
MEYSLDTSLAIETATALDRFTFGYITAAFFTLTGDDGESMDHLGLHDLSAEALASMKADCDDFQQSELGRKVWDRYDNFRMGVDFWFTRNGHGSGFWDGGYPTYGDALTAHATAYGSSDLYLGDDGQLHVL